ncbi:hypothetical protein KP509_18G029800 [Ceratopteris richardii]|uniref:Transcription repressor n=1 Tax=Ceratopteris richardii TaxID=49495 RepID=A0A8T2SS40_CERRI|nr:hypothetical protein KP509_18G029800 [Ceratopteris richardii]
MGRRTAMNVKVELPSMTSFMAIVSLLKKAPSGILSVESAARSLLSCSANPTTPSLRYGDAPSIPPHVQRRSRRAKSAAVLPFVSCAARPHTDSFRIHHVVNQEALEYVLTLEDACEVCEDDISNQLGQDEDKSLSNYGFYDLLDESQDSVINCSLDAIIRDGDRLLRDDLGNEGASASVMSTCSSRLSNCTSVSISSVARTAFTHNSNTAESEECQCSYGTASSASFEFTSGQPEHYTSSSCSSPMYFQSANSGHSAGNPYRRSDSGGSSTCSADDNHVLYTGNNEDGDDREEDYEESDADEDGCDGIVAETCYSQDPLQDFEQSMAELISCRHLMEHPDELHAVYCRYIDLNPPALHPTIAMAFFHALQRLLTAPSSCTMEQQPHSRCSA